MWDKCTELYTVILSFTKFANYKGYFKLFDKNIFLYVDKLSMDLSKILIWDFG